VCTTLCAQFDALDTEKTGHVAYTPLEETTLRAPMMTPHNPLVCALC
jgi:hypothetical protein